MPIKFAPIDATAKPVCRKHVGYVSMACKLMAKNVMASQNFMAITDAVLTNAHSGSKVHATKKKRRYETIKEIKIDLENGQSACQPQ